MQRLQKTGLAEESWVISITDPESTPLFRQDGPRLTVHEFFDVDPAGWHAGLSAQFLQEYPPMTAEDARRMVALIRRAQATSENAALYVQCEAGISRSGGVAEFVQRVCGLSREEFVADNRGLFPNMHVLSLLRAEWER